MRLASKLFLWLRCGCILLALMLMGIVGMVFGLWGCWEKKRQEKI